MTDCCEGIPTEAAVVPKRRKRGRTHVEFASLSPEAQQQCAEFLLLGEDRHEEDLRNIRADLAYLKKHFNIVPKGIYIAKWIVIRGK